MTRAAVWTAIPRTSVVVSSTSPEWNAHPELDTEAGHGRHDHAGHDARAEDEGEPGEGVEKPLFRAFHLARIAARRHVLKAGPHDPEGADHGADGRPGLEEIAEELIDRSIHGTASAPFLQ